QGDRSPRASGKHERRRPGISVANRYRVGFAIYRQGRHGVDVGLVRVEGQRAAVVGVACGGAETFYPELLPGLYTRAGGARPNRVQREACPVSLANQAWRPRQIGNYQCGIVAAVLSGCWISDERRTLDEQGREIVAVRIGIAGARSRCLLPCQ